MTVYAEPLIPVTSTAHELALSRAMKFTSASWHAALSVGDIRHTLPTEAIPFLLWEYGLDELAPFVTDQERLLREGRRWQRIRGTPASIGMALGWIEELPFDILEEDPDGTWWDLFQISLKEPVDIEIARRAIRLARLSKPAHTDVIRMYSGCDHRPFKVDEYGFIDDLGLVDDWSGAYIGDGEPKVSFCRTLNAPLLDFEASAEVKKYDVLTDSSWFDVSRAPWPRNEWPKNDGWPRGLLPICSKLDYCSNSTYSESNLSPSVSGAHTLTPPNYGWPVGPWPTSNWVPT